MEIYLKIYVNSQSRESIVSMVAFTWHRGFVIVRIGQQEIRLSQRNKAPNGRSYHKHKIAQGRGRIGRRVQGPMCGTPHLAKSNRL